MFPYGKHIFANGQCGDTFIYYFDMKINKEDSDSICMIFDQALVYLE